MSDYAMGKNRGVSNTGTDRSHSLASHGSEASSRKSKKVDLDTEQAKDLYQQQEKELLKIKMRDMFSQKMLDTANQVSHIDQGTIDKLKNRVASL